MLSVFTQLKLFERDVLFFVSNNNQSRMDFLRRHTAMVTERITRVQESGLFGHSFIFFGHNLADPNVLTVFLSSILLKELDASCK